MSASLGFSSLVSLDNAHLSDMQTAADTIRNGSFLSLSQLTEAIGNNSDASLQVETSLDAPRERVKKTPEESRQLREEYARAAKNYQEKWDKLGDCPLSPRTQALKDARIVRIERVLAKANCNKEESQEKLPAQRVLSEAFCINRLDRIRKLAGNERLKDFIHKRLESRGS